MTDIQEDNGSVVVSFRLPPATVEILKKIARKMAFEQDKEISYVDLIRNAIDDTYMPKKTIEGNWYRVNYKYFTAYQTTSETKSSRIVDGKVEKFTIPKGYWSVNDTNGRYGQVKYYSDEEFKKLFKLGNPPMKYNKDIE